MKKFIIKIILFALPVLAASIAIEILLRKIPNDYVLKKQYLDRHAAEIETLILGSSHSYYGINPDYFSAKTYNAAYISQTLNYDYKILKKYLGNLKSLKHIVIPVSYAILFSKLEAGSESWRTKNYTIYYGFRPSQSLTEYSEVLSNRFNVNMYRLISYYGSGNTNTSSSKLGWGTNYKSKKATDLAKTGTIAAKRHTRDHIHSGKYQQIFKENQQLLESVIQCCKEKAVRVLFLMPPAYETYRQHLNPDQLKITIETMKKLCSKYNNCIYLNLLSDSNFVAADFYDADHLSEKGAKKLSEQINQILTGWNSSRTAGNFLPDLR